MKELTIEVESYCNCAYCEFNNKCPHNNSFRRYPVEFGGAGECYKVRKNNKKFN